MKVIIICILLALIVPEIYKRRKVEPRRCSKYSEQIKDYVDVESLSKKPVSICIDLSHSSSIDRDMEIIEKTVEKYAKDHGIKVIHNREVK